MQPGIIWVSYVLGSWYLSVSSKPVFVEFLTKQGSDQSAQLQRLARILKFCMEKVLILYFLDVVHMQESQIFSHPGQCVNSHSLNMHGEQSGETSGLRFWLTFHLLQYIVYVSSEGSDKTVQMLRLA